MSDQENREQNGAANGAAGGAVGGSPNMAMPNVPGLQPPPPLKELTPKQWKQWKTQWQNYAVVCGLDLKPEKYKIALFLYSIGPKNVEKYNTFGDKTTLDSIIKQFEEAAVGEVNESYERYVFNKRNQKESESFEDFVTSLLTLSESCNFCDCLKESLIRDRIIAGIANPGTRKKLLGERGLTLKRTIDICRGAEATDKHSKMFDQPGDDIHGVRPKSRRGKPKSRFKKPNKSESERTRSQNTDKDMMIKCHFCAKSHIKSKEKCPAYGKRCKACGGRNHFKEACKKTTVKGVENETYDDYYAQEDSDTSTEYIGLIQS